MALTKAAQYRAYAATSVANAEAAADKTTRDVNLAIAQHFYFLAEDELSRVAPHYEAAPTSNPLDRSLVDVEA
jgi:hypothetical protein